MNSWRGYTRNPDGTLSRIVVDHGPSSARIPGHRGHLVVGEPGSVEADRIRKHNRDALTKNQKTLDARPIVNGRPRVYASDEERLAARREQYRRASQQNRDRLREAVGTARSERVA